MINPGYMDKCQSNFGGDVMITPGLVTLIFWLTYPCISNTHILVDVMIIPGLLNIKMVFPKSASEYQNDFPNRHLNIKMSSNRHLNIKMSFRIGILNIKMSLNRHLNIKMIF